MSKARLKQGYRKSSSLLHRAVGNILLHDIIFEHAKIYQEYPVNRISRYFDSGREKFDWVILDPFRAIIECHGEQHYKPVRFGGITDEEAQENYKGQVARDEKKKEAAEKAGYAYIVIKYDEKPTAELIIQRIADHEFYINDVEENFPESPKRKWYQRAKERCKQWAEASGAKERQREYRKQQYEKAKAHRLKQKTTKTSD